MGHQGILGLLAAALAWMSIGCGTILRNAAEEVTPAVIAGAVAGMTDPQTQRRLVDAVDEGQIETVSARLSAGMVDGMLDTLEDPARKARLEAIVNGLVENASGTLVDSMFEHALEDKVQARMRAAMRATTIDLINATFETIGSNMGSAEERTQAMGAVAHEISKQVTLGFQDALDDTRRDRASGAMPKADGALLIAAGNASATGGRILWTLGIGLAVVALMTIITLIWAIRKNRLRRSELAQRDDALLLLTEAIKSTATRPGADELHTALKTSLRDRKGGEYFLKMLGEQGRTLLGMQDKAG
ncbi:MAG: hypothetical protein M0R80_22775 [Proteobacteria bacterium]|jgi:hypothetical protein|nr:hypothetical protein [Pseudomonadota bacterium]